MTMSFPHSRVLVTGAAGFIGARLCQRLQEIGAKVHALTLDGSLPATLPGAEDMVVHAADITDLSAVRSVVRNAKAEIIFHLAAYGTPLNERDVSQMVDVNIKGTQNILMAAVENGCKGFVVASSAKEYEPGRTPISEEQKLSPWDEYAVTKASAAYFCQVASLRSGLPVTVLRFSPVYGPGEPPSRFFPAAIAAAVEEKPFTISVSSLVRNFTYVDDAVEALIRAAHTMKEGYRVYNIGIKDVSSFEDVLGVIEKVTGKTIQKTVVPYPSGKDDSWVVDSSRAKHELGWEATVSLEEGVKRTVQWYQEEKE